MNRRQYLLIAPMDGEARPLRLHGPKSGAWIVSALDDGDRVVTLSEGAFLLVTAQNISKLTERVRAQILGDGMFMLADVTDSSRAGNLPKAIWNQLEQSGTSLPEKPNSDQAA